MYNGLRPSTTGTVCGKVLAVFIGRGEGNQAPTEFLEIVSPFRSGLVTAFGGDFYPAELRFDRLSARICSGLVFLSPRCSVPEYTVYSSI